MSKRKVYTVAVVGDTRVGKTCLVNKLCYGTIPLEYEPTIEDLHTTILLTEKVEVIDTSADSAATVLRRAAMRSADAVMFVVDIQDITSIHHLPHHLQEYQQVRCSDCPCLVVGLARHRGPVSQEAVERAQQMVSFMDWSSPPAHCTESVSVLLLSGVCSSLRRGEFQPMYHQRPRAAASFCKDLQCKLRPFSGPPKPPERDGNKVWPHCLSHINVQILKNTCQQSFVQNYVHTFAQKYMQATWF